MTDLLLESRSRTAVGALKWKLGCLTHLLFDILVVSPLLLAVGMSPFVALITLNPALSVIFAKVYLFAVVTEVIILILREAMIAQILVGT